MKNKLGMNHKEELARKLAELDKHICLCDGKHVCLKCQKKENDYYKEE